MRWIMLFLLAVVPAASGCGDDNGTTSPGTGTIQVTTATTGTPGEDYTIIVDGASPRIIAATAALDIPDVEVGTHVVQLTLPTGCTIDGENPRTVNVAEGATATVAFVVTCTGP
jgi:hypothetical protein